jgi:hypothetical protein
MSTTYTYQASLEAAQKVNWKVEDLIGGDKRLDFGKRFLPEGLARTGELSFLSDDERRVLSQIRGHGYLYMFGLVEEFILPFVLDHARPDLSADDYKTRALLQFASEEAKHIQLFKRFREEFLAGFGTRCDVIGPPEAIAEAVLSKSRLAVAITILHIEWMVHSHFVDSVKDVSDMDPQFKSLLKHHWQEEVQHAKLDTLMVEALAATCTPEEIDAALGEYLEIGGMFDEGLKQQTAFEMDAFERATGRTLTGAEREEFMKVQHQANRWTFLGSAMTHRKVLESIGDLSPEWRRRIEQEIAPLFC